MAMFGNKPDPKKPAKKGDTDYERRKAEARKRNIAITAAGQEIGSVPPIANPARRKSCKHNLKLFCERYFPNSFNKPWSKDHLRIIKSLETAILNGGLFAYGMPRGSGKTTLALAATIWAAVYGHHKMISLLASIMTRGKELLEALKVELEHNDALADDFPEVCHPIRNLEGTVNRCKGQKCDGKRTLITWTKEKIILPTVQDSAASGVIIKVGGLTGGDVRGQFYKRPDGVMQRPSFVLLDDPQTDKTARSKSGNEIREKLLQGAVLGMAGPGEKIAAVMPCTVIEPGDMVDHFLDRDKHPDWNGVRTKMVYAWPSNEKLWEKYAGIRAEGLRAGDEGAAGTEFYRKHRAAMDAGAEVAWPARFDPGELSAIQNAINLRLRDETAFFAEFQNEPMSAHSDSELLTTDEIAAKVSGIERGKIPTGCNYLTMHQDVHNKLIYWLIAAWGEGFSGTVVDYGTWPEQKKSYFTMRTVNRTLGRAAPGAGREGAIFAGLQKLNDKYLNKEYKRDDGAKMRVNLAMIDSGWETDVVNQFIRQYPSGILFPSKGIAVVASNTPWENRKQKKGELLGHHWKVAAIHGRARGRYVQIDTNFWKSFIHAHLAVSMGDPGCLSLYGERRSDGQPKSLQEHRMLSEHLTAEYRVTVVGNGRSVDEWKMFPNRPDNHLLDNLVGCAVGASMLGVSATEKITGDPAEKKTTKAQKRKVAYI